VNEGGSHLGLGGSHLLLMLGHLGLLGGNLSLGSHLGLLGGNLGLGSHLGLLDRGLLLGCCCCYRSRLLFSFPGGSCLLCCSLTAFSFRGSLLVASLFLLSNCFLLGFTEARGSNLGRLNLLKLINRLLDPPLPNLVLPCRKGLLKTCSGGSRVKGRM
jgi:hypothetical protein